LIEKKEKKDEGIKIIYRFSMTDVIGSCRGE